MKKVLSVLLAAAMLFCISCKSDAVESVEGMIAALGEITLESGEAIEAAKNALLSLTEKERKQVENADILIKAVQTLDRLKAEALEAAYQSAKNLLKKGKYAESIEAFTALGDYKDSAACIGEAQRGIRYLEAVALVESDKPFAARDAFIELNDVADAADFLSRFKTVEITEENWETYFSLGVSALFVDDAEGQLERMFLCYGLFPNEPYVHTLRADEDQQVTVSIEYDCKQVDLTVDRAAHTYETYTTLAKQSNQKAEIVFDASALLTGGTYANFFAAAADADSANVFAQCYSKASDAKAWGYGMEITELEVVGVSGSVTVFE